MDSDRIEAILHFWFGELSSEKDFPVEKAQKWFQGGEAFDAEIRDLFLEDLEQAIEGNFDDWIQTSRGRLALIILLDQFSRNLFRGTPKAFSQDAKALQLAIEGIEQGQDQQLYPVERTFFYLPFEHSEDIQMQERCVELYKNLSEQVSPEIEVPILNNVDYAIQHYDIVKRFGRFPHRNQILNRQSTPEEIEFLSQPNSSF